MMQNNIRELAALAEEASAQIITGCTVIAIATGQDTAQLAADVMIMLNRIIPRRTKDERAKSVKRDGRETVYAVRVQLVNGMIMADSHPELDPNAVTTDMLVSGLLHVAKTAEAMARQFHDEPVAWPTDAYIEQRMRTIRVTLTRGGGQGRWPIRYNVGTSEWTASILIARKEIAEAREAGPAHSLRRQEHFPNPPHEGDGESDGATASDLTDNA